MRAGAAFAAVLLALSAGASVAVFAQTGTTTQTGGASTKWQAPVPDIDALTCAAPTRLYQIRLDTGDGAIYYCDGTVWQPLGGGGGASTLDDLTDVATAGAAAGEALTYTGTGWAPSAAAVIQEGDARLTDARAPTAHADSHEVGGSDPVELALDDLSNVEADGAAAPGDLLIFDGDFWVNGVPQLEDLGGTLPAFKGGTGLDTSASTGVPSITAGAWSVGDVALGSQTTGGYAASVSEGGPATTATALAANGADCAAGQWAAGVDASGAAEGCTPDATLSGAAAGGDLAGTYPDPTIAADAVGLAELAACPGPDEIVEYGASGVPSCIATPSGGGGGTPGGSDTQAQYNDGGAFGGMAGVLWNDALEELTIQGRTDAATERVAIFSGPDRVTPAVGDESSFSLFSDTSTGFAEMGRVTWKTNAAAAGTSRIDFAVNLSGTMTTALRLTSYGLSVPAVGFPAGTASTPGWNFGAVPSDNGDNEGCYWVSNGIVACVGQGSEAFRWQAGILRLPTTGALTWSTDAGFTRGAAARMDVTDGSTGAGSLSALMTLHVPQATAPTCPAAHGGTYFDSSGSGAFCICYAGSAWVMLHDFGSGNCT